MTAVLVPGQPVSAAAPTPVPAGVRRPRRWAAVQPVGLAGLAVAGAATTYSSLFADRSWWAPCFGAVLVSAALMLATERLRLPWVARLLAVMLLFPVAAAPALFWSSTWTGIPSPGALADVGRAVSHGWRDLVTFGLPVDPSASLLALPAAVLWMSAATAVLIVRRLPGLGLAVLAPALAPVVFTLVVAAPDGIPRTGLGIALASSLLLAVGPPTATGRPGTAGATGDGHSGRGELARGAAVTALATAVGLAVAQVGPPLARDRFAAGGLSEAPVDAVALVSPLAEVKPLLEAPERVLFTIEGPAVDRVRLAALDQYDGALWTLEAPFRPVRGALPDSGGSSGPAAGSDRNGTPTRHRITVAELPGPFLPTIGDPQQADAEGLRFSPDTGTLIRAPGRDNRLTYILDSLVPAPRDDELGAATRSTSADLDRFRRLPSPPAPLVSLAQQAVAGADPARPHAQLSALADFLRSGYDYDDNLPPGHSYAYLTRFLTDPDYGRGYAEQFATSFAVLARVLGHPARVVVGTDLDSEAAGSRQVTADRIHVWAEVHLDPVGWTVFDPTPLRSDTDPPARSGQPLRPPADSTDLGTRADIDIVPTTEGGGSGSSWADRLPEPVVLGPSFLAAVVTVGLLIVGAKRWRRHRRRVGPPARRVLGAWREAVDRLVESGLAVRRSQSARELAAAGVDHLGPEVAGVLTQLVPVVDLAIYDREGPDEAAAAGAWSTLAAFERRLRPRLGLRRRLLAPLDPRPLVRVLR